IGRRGQRALSLIPPHVTPANAGAHRALSVTGGWGSVRTPHEHMENAVQAPRVLWVVRIPWAPAFAGVTCGGWGGGGGKGQQCADTEKSRAVVGRRGAWSAFSPAPKTPRVGNR